MIPLPMLTGLPWRAIGWAAVVAAVGLAGWRVSAWHNAYEALPGVQAALEAEEACLPPSKCSARLAALQAAQEQVQREVVSGHEQELADLRNRPIPVRTVRLCPDNRDLQGAGPTGAAHGAGAGAAVLPEAPGRDIGPELYQLARDADEVAARLRALQQWNAALSQPGD